MPGKWLKNIKSEIGVLYLNEFNSKPLSIIGQEYIQILKRYGSNNTSEG